MFIRRDRCLAYLPKELPERQLVCQLPAEDDGVYEQSEKLLIGFRGSR